MDEQREEKNRNTMDLKGGEKGLKEKQWVLIVLVQIQKRNVSKTSQRINSLLNSSRQITLDTNPEYLDRMKDHS